MRQSGPRKPSRQLRFALTFSVLWLQACGSPEEARRVDLPVFADPSGIAAVTTDLGYEVELTDARAAIENLTFSLAGELHTSLPRQRLSRFLLSKAHAHPGHFQGGEIAGELRGRFVLDWISGGEELGRATLLVGTYRSANFTFASARVEDGAKADGALVGHTAVLRGTATRDGETLEFQAVIDSHAGREMIGVPFVFAAGQASEERLGLRLLTEGFHPGSTLFDGIDFFELSPGDDGRLSIGPESSGPTLDAYNLLRRRFQTHDHFDVKATP